jgi:hypothetical protein
MYLFDLKAIFGNVWHALTFTGNSVNMTYGADMFWFVPLHLKLPTKMSLGENTVLVGANGCDCSDMEFNGHLPTSTSNKAADQYAVEPELYCLLGKNTSAVLQISVLSYYETNCLENWNVRVPLIVVVLAILVMIAIGVYWLLRNKLAERLLRQAPTLRVIGSEHKLGEYRQDQVNVDPEPARNDYGSAGYAPSNENIYEFIKDDSMQFRMSLDNGKWAI